MVIKSRSESVELKCLKSLNARSHLSEKDKMNYLYAEKDFEGELKLDALLETLSSEYFILQDLLLEHNNTFFQIDTLMIFSQTIYLFEVKNYEGVYYINGDRWYSEHGNEIKNPVHQMNRCEALLGQLLQPLKLNLKIQSLLIFIHPEFTLFEAPRHLPIILPTQLNKFLRSLSMSSLELTPKHKKFTEYLIANHLTKSPYTRIPDYNYEDLKKGVLCAKCNSFMTLSCRNKLICDDCGFEEPVDTGVLRIVKEFKLLFPDRKITVSAITEWCEVVNSKKVIRRILQKNFRVIVKGPRSYYVD